MRGLVAVAVLFFAGCESVLDAQIPSPEQATHQLNQRFAGEPVEAVLATYGMPQGQFKGPTTGLWVFLWHTTGTLRLREPVTTTTTGRIASSDTPFGWATAVPYEQVSTSDRAYNVQYACTMQVGVRSDGVVERVALEGKMGACVNFL